MYDNSHITFKEWRFLKKKKTEVGKNLSLLYTKCIRVTILENMHFQKVA